VQTGRFDDASELLRVVVKCAYVGFFSMSPASADQVTVQANTVLTCVPNTTNQPTPQPARTGYLPRQAAGPQSPALRPRSPVIDGIRTEPQMIIALLSGHFVFSTGCSDYQSLLIVRSQIVQWVATQLAKHHLVITVNQ